MKGQPGEQSVKSSVSNVSCYAVEGSPLLRVLELAWLTYKLSPTNEYCKLLPERDWLDAVRGADGSRNLTKADSSKGRQIIPYHVMLLNIT
jgi:hypothetical protein